MAHPQLTRRGDRGVLLAAGLAATLLLAPAADASPLGLVLDCSPEAVAGDAALQEQCRQAGLLSGLATVLPEPVQSVVDPIEKVVDDVLKKAPAVIQDPVGQAPGIVDDVVESLPAAPAPAGPPLSDPAPEAPPPDVGVGTVDASAPTVRPSGPPQGPGIAVPPFIRRGVPSDVTVSQPSPQPFVAPVVSGPFFGDMARLAEDFVSSRSPVSSSIDAFAGLGGSSTSTAPGPDAPSWLLATASGMLLLLGAGHLLHARRRYASSVAR